jgi:hypothetical protein
MKYSLPSNSVLLVLLALVKLLVHLGTNLFGDSLFTLRLLPAVAGAAAV